MAEYWKSTPKYWCKHCNTYVRDTKLERTNHEATPKHQGNLKRFLRDLHRGHEKDEKDKERAKAEVARLNGMTAGGGAASSSLATGSSFGRGPTPSLPKTQAQATPSQRKQQLAQLAELGVSIPEGFRPDMAMAGEWQITSERIIEPEGEKKLDALALGVRKRVIQEDEEEGEGEGAVKKRRWGSTYKTYPAEAEDAALEALLNDVTRKDKAPAIKSEEESQRNMKQEPGTAVVQGATSVVAPVSEEKTNIKLEPSEGLASLPLTIPQLDHDVKHEDEEQNAPSFVFRKRKAKNIRQK